VNDDTSIGDLRVWWFVGAIGTGFGLGSLIYNISVRPMLPIGMPWWSAWLFGVLAVGVATLAQPAALRVGWLLGPACVFGELLLSRSIGTQRAALFISFLLVIQGCCFLWGTRRAPGRGGVVLGLVVLVAAAFLRLLVLNQWDHTFGLRGGM
jgi:hypothetical protein